MGAELPVITELHIFDYIQRYGCPMNYDGSRGENIGKTNIKDNAERASQQKSTLHYNISKRIVKMLL